MEAGTGDYRCGDAIDREYEKSGKSRIHGERDAGEGNAENVGGTGRCFRGCTS